MQNRLVKLQRKLQERHDPQLSVEEFNELEEVQAKLKANKPLEGKAVIAIKDETINSLGMEAHILSLTEIPATEVYKNNKHAEKHHSHDAINLLIATRGMFAASNNSSPEASTTPKLSVSSGNSATSSEENNSQESDISSPRP